MDKIDKNHGKERRRSKLKDELDELFTAPVNNVPVNKKWHRVPITVNHHKWWLHWHRYGDGGEFLLSFVSPAGRRYTYFVDGGIVAGADVANAKGAIIASYYRSLGDKYDKLDAVLRLTPRHVIDRLFVLLDTIKQRFDGMHDVHDLFAKYAPAGAELLDYIRWHDEYIVFFLDTQYIIQHLTASGLYYGHYYDDAWDAYREFRKIK